jgi:hypothetical protein
VYNSKRSTVKKIDEAPFITLNAETGFLQIKDPRPPLKVTLQTLAIVCEVLTVRLVFGTTLDSPLTLFLALQYL